MAMDPIAARATSQATLEFAQRYIGAGLPSTSFRVLGRTGLTVSVLGFGAYRVDSRSPEHRRALEEALKSGCNLVDTSTNYADGESEECIGAVLEAGILQGTLSRKERVVVSKIGYVQGHNMDLARERETAGHPFPEMVKISEGCWHCLHPEFLEDQLTRSLQRLKLACLDVCLLHNPEYFLERAHRQGQEAEGARQEFYRRIRAAFVHFEKEVRAGRIAWYGVSSNSFGVEPANPEATSLGRMLEAAGAAAQEAGSEGGIHHLAVAQLPMNLFEHGPTSVRKEGPAGNRSCLALAAENGIGVLVNRPLNAFRRGELIRLSDFPLEAPGVPLDEAQQRVRTLEDEFDREIGGQLRTTSGEKVSRLFDWGQQLAGATRQAWGYEHWQSVQDHQISPRLFHAVGALRSGLPTELSGKFEEWLARYLPALGDLLAIFRAQAAASSQQRSDGIAAALNPELPEPLRGETLSRKALHAVASVPGVSCVLNGMRHSDYVADSMEILKWSPIPGAGKLFGLL
ncbi:MAG: aldo/keto reductase [Acidobacteria bacterium]|nr:aldo/keto reductase [Acidobacteriota bacterium]